MYTHNKTDKRDLSSVHWTIDYIKYSSSFRNKFVSEIKISVSSRQEISQNNFVQKYLLEK